MTPHGSRALVTGGSRGIGLAYAEALASAGCDVVLNHYRAGEKAQSECARIAAASGRRIFEIDADVGESSSARQMVDQAADHLGGLDIVVANAGICAGTLFMELSDESWQRHLAVNLSGGFYVGQQASRHLIAAKQGGRIVFTTSISALCTTRTQVHYGATKAGLQLLMQGLAIELGCHGITVNAIAPGNIFTDLNSAYARDEVGVNAWAQARCPIGRIGLPADLQAALLFFVSREAAYVTGSSVLVDGGWNAQI